MIDVLPMNHFYLLKTLSRLSFPLETLSTVQSASHHLVVLWSCCVFRMGNVLAASSPNPPPAAGGGAGASGGAGLVNVPPGFAMPPVSPVPPNTGTAAQAGGEAEGALPNPGTFEECHRKCKGEAWNSGTIYLIHCIDCIHAVGPFCLLWSSCQSR